MFRKVKELLEIEFDYKRRLLQLIPSQYAEDPQPRDELHAAWRDAVTTANEQHHAIYRLLQRLSTRAPGLDGELEKVAAETRNGKGCESPAD